MYGDDAPAWNLESPKPYKAWPDVRDCASGVSVSMPIAAPDPTSARKTNNERGQRQLVKKVGFWPQVTRACFGLRHAG